MIALVLVKVKLVDRMFGIVHRYLTGNLILNPPFAVEQSAM